MDTHQNQAKIKAETVTILQLSIPTWKLAKTATANQKKPMKMGKMKANRDRTRITLKFK
jgi:hypothetical protein